MTVARMSVLTPAVLLCVLVALLSGAAPAALGAVPAIEEESVIEAAGTSVTLQATIDPEGAETTYRVEYGVTAAYGSTAPEPEGQAGSGSAGVTVSVHIQGLSPSTLYHYRVVASSPGGVDEGVDGTFSTQPVGGTLALPDGRQWELVSPPNKHGAPLSRKAARAARRGARPHR
ncbi:MAG TPA: hypothetical protein VNV42_14975 [Solirubrobacteraceae bacterium]|jgi:hypothetical protein|nr:hypothetical protein [Solirubrobacteraceae bacterium]